MLGVPPRRDWILDSDAWSWKFYIKFRTPEWDKTPVVTGFQSKTRCVIKFGLFWIPAFAGMTLKWATTCHSRESGNPGRTGEMNCNDYHKQNTPLFWYWDPFHTVSSFSLGVRNLRFYAAIFRFIQSVNKETQNWSMVLADMRESFLSSIQKPASSPASGGIRLKQCIIYSTGLSVWGEASLD